MSSPKTKNAKPVKAFGYNPTTKKWVAIDLTSLESNTGRIPFSLITEQYNSIHLSGYINGNPQKIEYKYDGEVVATITLSYDGDDLLFIEKL